ncbi:MAG TPA: protoporphyrinogen oxidase [Oculatellaceae cyanobacterium]
MKIAIIGGGIAGLTAAHRLLKESASSKKQVNVDLFEASSRFGGIIETLVEDELVVELGPDAFTTLKHDAVSFCDEIGLTDRIVPTRKENRRAFIAHKGVLNPIPTGFVLIATTRFDTFFRSQLLSPLGKRRLAMEQFIAPAPPSEDESVASFVRRRFGPEAVERIAQPMIGGIYTANIETLSLKATMPQYIEYEARYGSVTAGLMRQKRNHNESGARYGAFVSFDRGSNVIVDRLVSAVGEKHLHLNHPIVKIERASSSCWRLLRQSGEAFIADRVILAVPSFVAARLLEPIDGKVSARLDQIEYASSAVACFLFKREQFKRIPDGFGFVIPASENRASIAVAFASVKFAGRCPEDKLLVRVFIGGATAPDHWQNSDVQLLNMALEDLRFYMGIEGEPERHWIKRWVKGMPQYSLGHLERVRAIEVGLARHEGIFWAGAGLRGVGIPDCIASGEAAAKSVLLEPVAISAD